VYAAEVQAAFHVQVCCLDEVAADGAGVAVGCASVACCQLS
jgi:hypothetical protein